MIRKTGIFFLVTLELLFLLAFQTTIHLLHITCISHVGTLDNEELLIMLYIL